MARQQDHELGVFRGFVSASGLNIPPDSIHVQDRPDIRCAIDSKLCLFELAEVLWKDPDPNAAVATLAHGLALSERASRRKAALRAEGRLAEAERIQTSGSFRNPPLAALLQVLESKCAKSYSTDNSPLSLLLYYQRASPCDPFGWLTKHYGPAVQAMLETSPFECVWLYHHPSAFSFDVRGAAPGVPIPLRAFTSPESQRSVIGRMRLVEGSLSFVFDSSFAQNFSAVEAELAEVIRPYVRGEP